MAAVKGKTDGVKRNWGGWGKRREKSTRKERGVYLVGKILWQCVGSDGWKNRFGFLFSVWSCGVQNILKQ